MRWPRRSPQRRGGPVEIRARRARRQAPDPRARRAQRAARARPGEAPLRAPPPAAGRGARRPPAGLGLDTIPLRIECFDISTLMGTNTVASMVVFEGGAPKKSDYRRFKVFTTAMAGGRERSGWPRRLRRDGGGARRGGWRRWEPQRDVSPHDKEYDPSFAALPNLVVIDGGKGQLSAGLRALQAVPERGVVVISLAKRIEEVFIPGRAAPLRLAHDTPGAPAAPARARRGPPVRHHPPPHPARPGDDRLDPRRAARASVRRASGRCSPTSAPRTRSSPPRREELEAVPGTARQARAGVYRELHKTGV